MPLPGTQRHKQIFEKKEQQPKPEFLQEVKIPQHSEPVVEVEETEEEVSSGKKSGGKNRGMFAKVKEAVDLRK